MTLKYNRVERCLLVTQTHMHTNILRQDTHNTEHTTHPHNPYTHARNTHITYIHTQHTLLVVDIFLFSESDPMEVSAA